MLKIINNVKMIKLGKISRKIFPRDSREVENLGKRETLVLTTHVDRAHVGFIQVNDGKKFDHIKTCTLTGTFKIIIAARVDLGILPLNYPF